MTLRRIAAVGMPSVGGAARQRFVVGVRRRRPTARSTSRASIRANHGARSAAENPSRPNARCQYASVASRRAKRARPVDRRAAADAAALEDVDRLVLRLARRGFLVERGIGLGFAHAEIARRWRAAPPRSGSTVSPACGEDLGGGAAAGAGADDHDIGFEIGVAFERRGVDDLPAARSARQGSRRRSVAFVIMPPIAAGRDSRSPATTPGCRTTRRTRADAARRRPNEEARNRLVAPALEERGDLVAARLRPWRATRAPAQCAPGRSRAARRAGASSALRRRRQAGDRDADVDDGLVHRGSRVGSDRRATRRRATPARPRSTTAYGIRVERERAMRRRRPACAARLRSQPAAASAAAPAIPAKRKVRRVSIRRSDAERSATLHASDCCNLDASV